MGNIKDGTILPILWIEVGIDKIPDTIMNLLYHAHYTANAVEAGLKYGSLFVFLSSSIVLGWISYKNTAYNLTKLRRTISGQDKLLKVQS